MRVLVETACSFQNSPQKQRYSSQDSASPLQHPTPPRPLCNTPHHRVSERVHASTHLQQLVGLRGACRRVAPHRLRLKHRLCRCRTIHGAPRQVADREADRARLACKHLRKQQPPILHLVAAKTRQRAVDRCARARGRAHHLIHVRHEPGADRAARAQHLHHALHLQVGRSLQQVAKQRQHFWAPAGAAVVGHRGAHVR
eukprot:259731-Chlamydomonas_euryale.AAC.10